MPNTFKIAPNWQNLAKSGHTGRRDHLVREKAIVDDIFLVEARLEVRHEKAEVLLSTKCDQTGRFIGLWASF